jgi:hypothetical protein
VKAQNAQEFIRAMGDYLFPRRLAAEVIGLSNGVLSVAVDGRVRNIEYAGTDELKAGTRVWVRKIPDDPFGGYSYEGFRIQQGSIQGGEPGKAHGSVSSTAVEKFLGVQVIDNTTGTPVTLPKRKYIEFRGGATITDDPTNDKIIVEIIGITEVFVDYDDAGVDYDDPTVAYGG